MTPADDSGIEPLEVWNDVLGDRREVSVEDWGLVVTHRIRATSPSTIQFQILDPLPAEFDIEDVGFHSDLEPGAGRIGTDRVVIAGVAEPQVEFVVKYGIQVGGQPRRHRCRIAAANGQTLHRDVDGCRGDGNR